MPSFLFIQFTNQLTLLRGLIRNPKFWIILCLDISLIILAHYFAYAIRFENTLEGTNRVQFMRMLPLLMFVKIPVFYAAGLYRGMWRYTSLRDLINILKGTLLASVIIVTVILYFNRFSGISRSVFILDTLFTFLFISGHRVLIRFYHLKHNFR